jgi:hypothetical protein
VRFSLGFKAVAALALIILFDRLFADSFGGARVGVFAGAWLLAIIATRRDICRARSA